MTDRILAVRYAQAFLDIAREEGLVDSFLDELDAVARAVSADPDWLSIIDNRGVEFSLKQKMLGELLDVVDAHELTRNFIGVLLERGRLEVLDLLVQEYKREALDIEDKIEVTVTVAVQQIWIRLKGEFKRAAEVLTGKEVVLKKIVDPEILGGFVINIDDTVYDCSVRGELKKVQKHLLERSQTFWGVL